MTAPGWNACLAYVNLADVGSWSASSAIAQRPASTLQNVHVGRKWRSLTNADAVTCDLLNAQLFDTVALIGTNLTAAGVTRLRISNGDPSGVAGEVYDSGSAAGRVDPNCGRLIFFMPAQLVGRYVRIDLSDAALSYIEAGRGVITVRNQVAVNFVPGASDLLNDPAVKKKSKGGQTYVDPASPDPFRVWEFTFDTLSETQRFGFIESADVLNGSRRDVLLCRNPASTNLSRDTIWGLMEMTPIVAQSGYGNDGLPVYSKVYRIEQRL
jgi:hypothetical protein